MVGEDRVLELLTCLEQGEEGEDHRQGEGKPITGFGAVGQAVAEGEQRLIVRTSISGCIHTEQHPS